MNIFVNHTNVIIIDKLLARRVVSVKHVVLKYEEYIKKDRKGTKAKLCWIAKQ